MSIKDIFLRCIEDNDQSILNKIFRQLHMADDLDNFNSINKGYGLVKFVIIQAIQLIKNL